jgi:hypothetical protein
LFWIPEVIANDGDHIAYLSIHNSLQMGIHYLILTGNNLGQISEIASGPPTTCFSLGFVETFGLSSLSIPTERVITILQISTETAFPGISFGQHLPDYSGTFTGNEIDVFARSELTSPLKFKVRKICSNEKQVFYGPRKIEGMELKRPMRSPKIGIQFGCFSASDTNSPFLVSPNTNRLSQNYLSRFVSQNSER